MLKLKTHQPYPDKFKEHSYKREYKSPYSEKEVWEWLNDPKTFTDNQTSPYRVEFLLLPGQEKAFEEGVFNSHHGPFMSFTGVIGEVNENYRDLKYLYGSYFLSFRWIRPHRLQFWSEPNGKGTKVTMQLDTYVKPSFYGFWKFAMPIFWGRFGRWMNKSIKDKK